ncbi:MULTISPECIES: hypothetical protein [Proteus]|uniref:hypothetical protein n=1 Tax=Proteus TaxID=583 RepID=UPI000D697309|nr:MULTISPECIES: hypothetical protein [Proteus]NBM13073.1 hypothetical protein [Proteus sp. G2670]NBM33298.1 hypothetical protein [Proteus sp. G2664]NBM88277.1 hypothetical protein [Proteus sp. G2661]
MNSIFERLTNHGSFYKEQPSDLIVPFLTLFLLFIDINNVQFILIEGAVIGEKYAQPSHN